MTYHATITVGTVPVKIYEAPIGLIDEARVYITNHDNAAVYVGDKNVATSGANLGFTIVKDSNYDFELNSGESLYAISSTSASVTVMVFGV